MQAIAEVPLAEELTIHAHDFDALFRETGAGVFRTLYAYTPVAAGTWRRRNDGGGVRSRIGAIGVDPGPGGADPGATATFGDQGVRMCPDHWTMVKSDGMRSA